MLCLPFKIVDFFLPAVLIISFSVKGKRYFTCQPKYGGFVRPSHCEVGDFPEEDLGFSDDDIDEM